MSENTQPATQSTESNDTDALLTRAREIIEVAPKGLFIDGEFVAAEDDQTLTVTNPADGTALAEVASASQADARRAVDSVCAAQEEWAATAPRTRSEILRRTFELLQEKSEDLALLQTLELGRALADSRSESGYGAEFFRWFAEEAVRARGEYRESPDGSSRILVKSEPVGPCLAITPWNFPLAMGARKIAPALAAGCTMVLKPASKTPLTMLYLADVLREAGLPAGVLAVIPTKHAANVSDLLDDARIRKFTFTGSTAAGQELAARAAEHSMKVSLELGGNAPYIVAADADLDAAAEAVATAKMRGAGQVCIAANRFLVHRDVAEEFTEKVAAYMRGLQLGPGYAPDVDYGPLSGKDQVEKVTGLVDDAVERGAVRLVGGELPSGLPVGGYYYPATVLREVPDGADILTEEIFGPVVVVDTFADDDEAIAKANNTSFGLAGYVFSQDLEHALRLADRVEAGMIAVNKGGLSDPAAPFGGVKESGLGREGGFQGIAEYQEEKFISLPK